jgi:hypothetical protein
VKSFRRPQGRSAAESGVGKTGSGDADSMAARCPKERCSSTVRSAAELHSAGRPQGGRHRRRAEHATARRPRQASTFHLWSTSGDCAGATKTGDARCRGSTPAARARPAAAGLASALLCRLIEGWC